MANVTDPLIAATRTYRAALAAVETVRVQAKAEAARKVDQAKARADAARTALAGAIVQAAHDGTRQRDIVKATGYSRERVRTILRAGGVEPSD
jgi:hypothetical protein